MVTKSTKTGAKQSRVKVKKLNLNRETVKDLTGGKQKQIKGGLIALTNTCAYCDEPTVGKTCKCSGTPTF